MLKMWFRSAVLIALLMVISLVSAQEQATEEASTEETGTFVRFAHFAADAPAVDVYVNGEMASEESLEFMGVSEWMPLAPDAGALDVAVVPSGGAVEEAVINATGVEFAGEGWFTVAVIGSGEELMTLTIQENILPLDEVLPGTATYTFVNALGDGRMINFNLDEVPYMTELGSDGTTTSFGTINEDAANHVFSASLTENDEVLATSEETEVVESSAYLIALVGGDAPQIVIHETPRAELEIAQGNLEAPGTIVEAARGSELLQPFGELAESAGLNETLSGEGPYTVFVPANYILDDLGEVEDLEGLLLNHVVEGDFKSLDLVEQGTFTTVGGQELTVEVQDNTILVNGVEVLTVNIPATNGTIHVIGGVLMPAESE
jgi:uncharacterized surface protein with fasciclin (FAS1) repeats